MIVLGIDPGTRCGWAILSDGHRIASGTWDLRPGRHEGGGMRYLRLRRYLCECLETMAVDAVGYEEVRRHMGTDAAHVYGGIVAVLQGVCEERSVPYRGIPVGTVKRCATGKGNAGKDAMLHAAHNRWGVQCGTHDEADALWVARALEEGL